MKLRFTSGRVAIPAAEAGIMPDSFCSIVVPQDAKHGSQDGRPNRELIVRRL